MRYHCATPAQEQANYSKSQERVSNALSPAKLPAIRSRKYGFPLSDALFPGARHAVCYNRATGMARI
jgi:hypothetical protein